MTRAGRIFNALLFWTCMALFAANVVNQLRHWVLS
jgi:hypothetical protein